MYGNGAKTVAKTDEIFNARDIVQILQGLMTKVTAETVTPATVQAACQCASQISTLLKIHLEAERMRRSQKD